MNEDLGTSEFKPGKIGGGQVHMVPTGHMKPIEPMKPKVVHKVIDKATNPASTPHQPVAGYGVTIRKAGTGEIIDYKEDISPAKVVAPIERKVIMDLPNRHPFEGYWTEYTYKTDALDIYIANGSVCGGDDRQVGVDITAGDGTLASVWTLTAAEPLIYLKTVFNADGSIYSCELFQGPLSDLPNAAGPVYCLYENGPSAGQNKWYQPLIRYRASRYDKSADSTKPDSGEERPAGGKELWTLSQLTNTHLVGQQQCMTDINNVIRTAWKLVPGPGALTGSYY